MGHRSQNFIENQFQQKDIIKKYPVFIDVFKKFVVTC